MTCRGGRWVASLRVIDVDRRAHGGQGPLHVKSRQNCRRNVRGELSVGNFRWAAMPIRTHVFTPSTMSVRSYQILAVQSGEVMRYRRYRGRHRHVVDVGACVKDCLTVGTGRRSARRECARRWRACCRGSWARLGRHRDSNALTLGGQLQHMPETRVSLLVSPGPH